MNSADDSIVKFYSNRLLNGVLVLLFAAVVYIVLLKELLDGMTPIATMVFYLILAGAVFMGLISLYRVFDPNPVVIMSEAGILIKKFVFFKEFIPWEEITDVREQQYKNRVRTVSGSVRVSATVLRIHRPGKRPVSINLTLLNKRGQEFHRNLERYLAS